MSDILSQGEIEALLTSLNTDEQENQSPADQRKDQSTLGRQMSALSYEIYDFRRPDKFSKEQLRTLQMLHETFGRLAGTNLSAYLRNSVHIDLISLEQVPYEEYLRSINQSVFTITSLSPLNGQSVLEIEFSLIFTMLDKMLGGPGRAIDRTVLTDIEIPLVKQIIERLYSRLRIAWEGVVAINPNVEGLETSAQFVQIAPPSDIVVSILFEVRIGDVRGAMSLCIPYMVLKPITSKLSSQKWFATGGRTYTKQTRSALVHHIESSSVNCTIQLGTTDVTVREFVNLKKDDVIVLDQKKDRDLIMNVGGNPKFLGLPALEGKNVVFTITGAHS